RQRLGAPLPAGGSAELDFEVLAGKLACGTRVPIQAQVSAPENLSPSIGGFELVTEQDVAASAQVWDFESGAQGWSGDGSWLLSRKRSFPSDTGQSFWSGADFNQCSALISPEITLDAALPSVLTLASWYQLEGRFQAKYW